MQTLTDNAAKAWLNHRGITVDSPRNVRFVERKPAIIHLSGGQSNDSSAYLAANLVGILDKEKDWLLWLTDFSIGTTEVEEIGWTIVESVLQSKLELDSSAFLFNQKETPGLKAVLITPLLFNWDALLVNADGKTFVAIDHDHGVTIYTLDEQLTNEIPSSQLQTWIRR
ncbi:MAG TPA: hypothetical protein VGK22_08670 [Candidatus Angelobacter sp.]|jgi:hypothetical protein